MGRISAFLTMVTLLASARSKAAWLQVRMSQSVPSQYRHQRYILLPSESFRGEAHRRR